MAKIKEQKNKINASCGILRPDEADPPVPKAYLNMIAEDAAGIDKAVLVNDLSDSEQIGTEAVAAGTSACEDILAREGLKRQCELPYFNVGDMIGGNQELFADPWMKIGGCAAVTACDLCIYLDLYKGTRGLYPYDLQNISKADYERFAMYMKPYLRPRYSGINKLETYTEGFGRYLTDKGLRVNAEPDADISLTGFSGSKSYSEARRLVMDSIDAGFPISYLNLYHRDPYFRDFVWHWFIIAGYAVFSDIMMVKIISYGKSFWFDFAKLWNTGHRRKGGMIQVRCNFVPKH